MSFAIIRNTKYKRENLKGLFRHNERRNQNYSNENIDKEKSYMNYSIKSPQYSYEKEFDRIRKEYNLKGQIKTVSNIACEYIITSDKEFFEGIGEIETKRYFETAYQFVSEYKNLGEQYILSAKVHLDEETPHLHLIFLPIVHTKDKKRNNIDKLACSEFWKAKDSYVQLQNAFYEYMVSNGFNLERGNPSNRKHLTVEELKEVTNYNKTKKTLEDIKLELPAIPNIDDIGKLTRKRDEIIKKEIIQPKDDLIEKLYLQNSKLKTELERQVVVIDEAEKYQKDRKSIIADNKKLHITVDKLETEYQEKHKVLENEFKDKSLNLEWQYCNKIHKLEKENNRLYRIVDKFHETITIFIKWICKKFTLPSEDEVIRDFEKETHTLLNAEKQISKEDREQDFDLDL